MNTVTLIAACTFGLEAIVKREVQALGFNDPIASDGKVTFQAPLEDIPKANLWLRTADRVLLKLAEFPATDFDKLFDQTRAVPWEQWIPRDGKITVTGKSVKSRLESVRANQSIVKKAVISRLQEKYAIDWLEETGAEFTIQIAIHKDSALLTLDTSGAGLHKRGYRKDTGEVPLRENLAAALVLLSFWDKGRILIDPMCGAGTILTEAAMIARNIAPGLKRGFAAEEWPAIGQKIWEDARASARGAISPSGNLRIFGYDIEDGRIRDAQNNARRAGVENDIVFAQKDIKELSLEQPRGIMISNPPYGVKLSSPGEVRPLYQAIDRLFRTENGWSVYVLTADKQFSQSFSRAKPNRVRKLYNGTLQVDYYQYFSAAK